MKRPIEALNHINEILSSFMVSQTFFTACRLGVFEKLVPGARSAEELAPELSLHPDGCRRLLGALRELGLLEGDGGWYRNSEIGEYLTSKAAVPIEPISQWGDFYHMWEFIADALRELRPQWQKGMGTTAEETWTAIYEDPARLRRFAGNMAAYSAPIAQVVAQRVDLSRYKCVLDVAGGPGAFAIGLGLGYPHLRGIIMDLPKVCEVADREISRARLSGRFASASADLFKGPYPKGADVAVLSWILHDWNDDNCGAILGNCYEALPAGGMLLVSESVLNDDFSGKRFAVLMSMHMALCTEPGSRERTETEYRRLLEGAGFRNVEIIRLDAPRDLIVARKP